MTGGAAQVATAPVDALYVVLDRRADGSRRIIDRFIDPVAANAAADLLRSAGAAVEVELVSDDGAPPG